MLVYIYPISLFPDLHSDKIFGAILATMSDLYPSLVENVIKMFRQGNPPFLISSAFPFIKIKNKKIRFYPKIMLSEDIDFVGDFEIIKNFEDIKFLQEEIFFDILNQNLSYNDILNNYSSYFQVDEYLLNEKLNIKDISNFSSKMIVPQNRVNRLNNSNKVFYNEGTKYNKSCGLFFHISIFNEEFISIISSIFRLLKDRGFGSKISSGKGQFFYELENYDVYKSHNSNFSSDEHYFVTISRFIPTEGNLNFIDLDSNYELGFKRRVNKRGNNCKQVTFFNEGSTFLADEKEYFGKLEYSSNISVEYGFAFPLKIKM